MEEDWIYGRRRAQNLEEKKELKVQLPIRFHVRLHSLKILQGRTMSDTITEALKQYFDRVEKEPAPRAG